MRLTLVFNFLFPFGVFIVHLTFKRFLKLKNTKKEIMFCRVETKKLGLLGKSPKSILNMFWILDDIEY
jgi:hypothetical protein